MKPMLSGTLKSLDQINYPVLCTPKIDGIRCLTVGGEAVSRSLKPIPNRHIRKLVSAMPEGLDGELVLANDTKFNNISSAVMAELGEPDFRYIVFDYWRHQTCGYGERIEVIEAVSKTWPDWMTPLTPELISNEQEFLVLEDWALSNGFEGVMLRKPDGPYKFGRSTLNEGYLLKWKQFDDGEAEILGFVEMLHNDNPVYTNEVGHAERSTRKAGKRDAGTLGALFVRDLKSGIEFKIGTGFDAEMRLHIWQCQSQYKGKIVKYKSQPHGSKEKPRFPAFLGFRCTEDMS